MIRNLKFRKLMTVGLLAGLTFTQAFLPAAAQETEEIQTSFGLLTIGETDDFERVLSAGDRAIVQAYQILEAGRVLLEDEEVLIFYAGDGGNGCGPDLVIVWQYGNAIRDAKLEAGCLTPEILAPVEDWGTTITFNPPINPTTEDAPILTFSRDEGLRQSGSVSFSADPFVKWSDITDLKGGHPHDLFGFADILKASKAMLGADYGEYVLGLSVTVGIEETGDLLHATGCQPHNCSARDSLIVVDTKTRQIFMAQLGYDEGMRLWPSRDEWPPQAEALIKTVDFNAQ